jgi:UDP-N-acetylmuramoyl-L-alanyl-D-glutamate--2,6-diaminopimelate ligase
MIENIVDSTKELTSSKIFLKTAQNAKYAKDIKNFITPKELLKKLNLKTKFIGITGTNGKTTTAFALSFLLKNAGFNVATQGTEGFFFNLEKKEEKTLTTPPIFTTVKRAYKYKPDFFVMEVSSHSIVQNRIEALEFVAKIFTSFSQDHLDFHKSIDEYRRVKESFFQDDVLKIVNGKKEKDIVKIGEVDFKFNLNNLYVLQKPILEDIPMAGEFNKMNLSLAYKCASFFTDKLSFDGFKGVSGRMEIINKNPFIVIDFAHTPDGIEKVLESVSGKKLVVFGAGGDRDKDKREKMGKVASKFADFIIITNDNPRCENPIDIANDIKKGINITHKIILNRKEAIKEALKIAKNFDVVLILGKGDEKFIEFCNKKVPFNDKEIVLELLKF